MMILVDTSIWVDHFRSVDETLQRLLDDGQVACHPFVIGEILVGNARNWIGIRRQMERLPFVAEVQNGEVLDFIVRHSLQGSGIGYIDFHLLVSTQLTSGTRLWSRDKRLATAAQRLGSASSQVPRTL